MKILQKGEDHEVPVDRTGGHGDPSMTNVKILWLCIEKLISKTHFHSIGVESSDMSGALALQESKHKLTYQEYDFQLYSKDFWYVI